VEFSAKGLIVEVLRKSYMFKACGDLPLYVKKRVELGGSCARGENSFVCVMPAPLRRFYGKSDFQKTLDKVRFGTI
jgi:hypothetical protein